MSADQSRGGNNPNLISLTEAVDMTTKYRDNKDSILDKSTDPSVLPICETFNRAAFEALLAQEGCESVRIYLAMDENLKIKLISVGVNANDADMISTSGGVLVDNGTRCPVMCPPSSALNQ